MKQDENRMLGKFESLAAKWDRAADKLENVSVEVSDVTYGDASRLRDCAESLREMCKKLRSA